MNRTPIRHTTDFWLTIPVMLITGIAVVLWNVFAPIGMDDYYFRTILEDNDIQHYEWCFNRRIENFGDAFTSAANLFRYDIGRWPNLLHILFTPLPTVVERIFDSIVLTGVFYMMAAIAAGGRRPGALTTVFVTCGIWTALPWYDSMYSLAFQANYIWPTAVMTAYILILPKVTQSRKLPARLLFLGLCVLLGQCHEAFGITAGAYTLGVLLITPAEKRRFTVIVLLFILVGLCINLYAGTWTRLVLLKKYESGYDSGLQFLFSRIISRSWPFWCSLMLLAVVAAADRKRRKAVLAENLPYALGILANAVILFVVLGMGRPSWPGAVMSILLAGNLLRPLFNRIPRRIAAAVVLIFAVPYAVWAVELVKWQKKIGKETAEMEANAERQCHSASDVYPGPYTSSADIPYWLMKTVRNPVDDGFSRKLMASTVKPAVNAPMLPALSPLMEGPYDQWPRIEGTADIRGVWPMIATDRVVGSRLRITYDDTLPDNMSPINRLLVFVREGRQLRKHVLDLCFNADTISTSDNRKVYMLNIEPAPRTVEGRKILRIDTIPQQ